MKLLIYLIVFSLFLSCSKGDNSSSDYSSSSNSGSSIASSSYSSSQSTGTSSSSSSSSSSSTSSSSSSTNLTELPSGTFVFNVTSQTSLDYIVSVADSNSTQSGNDPILRVKEGDELSFNVNASGHPFLLKTTQGTGTNDQIDGVNNNGADEGTVTWSVPIGSAGTYYYQCSIHGDMVGQIIVEQ